MYAIRSYYDGYVEERMNQIEEFAELGEFFDREIRTYSSGMKIRLRGARIVVPQGDSLIAPWTEGLRYGIKKNGRNNFV